MKIKIFCFLIIINLLINFSNIFASEYYSYQTYYDTMYGKYDSENHPKNYYDYFDQCIEYNFDNVIYHQCKIYYKGFRDLANPNDGLILCGKLGYPDQECLDTIQNKFIFFYNSLENPYIPDYKIKTAYFIPPYLKELGSTIYCNIDANITACMRYKEFPECNENNPEMTTEAEIMNSRFINIYKNDVYQENIGGHFQPIPPEGYSTVWSEDESGWFFMNQVVNMNGIGIAQVFFRFAVDYSKYKNWYDNIKEPKSEYYKDNRGNVNINFFKENCVDSNHPENYNKHECNSNDTSCINSIVNDQRFFHYSYSPYDNKKITPQVWRYYTKKDDTSGKKYYYCWYPAGNYPDGSTIWDIWSGDILYSNSQITISCSSSNLNYCENQNDCENAGGKWDSDEEQCNEKPKECSFEYVELCDEDNCTKYNGYWYHEQCNKENQSEACKKDKNYCDNQTLCENAGYKWNDDNEICDYKCSNEHLDKCENESECSEAGGQWDNGNLQCNEKLNCTSANLNDCKNVDDCQKAGGDFINGECVKHITQCNSTNLSACRNEQSCVNAGGEWVQIAFIGKCQEKSGGGNSQTNLTDKEKCEKDGGYWYFDSKCYTNYPAMPNKNLEFYDTLPSDTQLETITVDKSDKIIISPAIKRLNDIKEIRYEIDNITCGRNVKYLFDNNISQNNFKNITENIFTVQLTDSLSLNKNNCQNFRIILETIDGNGNSKVAGYILKFNNGSCNNTNMCENYEVIPNNINNKFVMYDNLSDKQLISENVKTGEIIDIAPTIDIYTNDNPKHYYGIMNIEGVIYYLNGKEWQKWEEWQKTFGAVDDSLISLSSNGRTINLVNGVKLDDNLTGLNVDIYFGYDTGDNYSGLKYNGIKLNIQ